MIYPEFEEAIREMSAPAKPTEAQIAEVLRAWEIYFQMTNIPLEGQMEEFNGIMRARVQAGSISLVAPDLEKLR